MGCLGSKDQNEGGQNAEDCTAVRTTRHEGQIDHSYLEPMASGRDDLPIVYESWYFGNIDINRCMKILGDHKVKSGTFIIRESSSMKGVLCISIKASTPKGPAVFSVRIGQEYDQNGFRKFKTAIDDNLFNSIRELISFYKVHKICAQGYEVTLVNGFENNPRHDRFIEDDWEIKAKDITVGEEIGKGEFGCVYKAQWKRHNITMEVPVVVKCSSDCDTEKWKKEFWKEVEVMKKIRHDNIVSIIGICIERNQLWIVQEFMSKGDLKKFLEKNQTTPLADLYYFAVQIASGMMFMASKNFIHRDLAARNILLGEYNVVKVADFGLSRMLDEQHIYQRSGEIKKLPVRWTCPEGVLQYDFSLKSDIWSYGILLTEIITRGKNPYIEIRDTSNVVQHVLQGYRMQKDSLGADCNDALYTIMDACWKLEPDRRPSFDQIYKDIYSLYKPLAPIQYM